MIPQHPHRHRLRQPSPSSARREHQPAAGEPHIIAARTGVTRRRARRARHRRRRHTNLMGRRRRQRHRERQQPLTHTPLRHTRIPHRHQHRPRLRRTRRPPQDHQRTRQHHRRQTRPHTTAPQTDRNTRTRHQALTPPATTRRRRSTTRHTQPTTPHTHDTTTLTPDPAPQHPGPDSHQAPAGRARPDGTTVPPADRSNGRRPAPPKRKQRARCACRMPRREDGGGGDPASVRSSAGTAPKRRHRASVHGARPILPVLGSTTAATSMAPLRRPGCNTWPPRAAFWGQARGIAQPCAIVARIDLQKCGVAKQWLGRCHYSTCGASVLQTGMNGGLAQDRIEYRQSCRPWAISCERGHLFGSASHKHRFPKSQHF